MRHGNRSTPVFSELRLFSRERFHTICFLVRGSSQTGSVMFTPGSLPSMVIAEPRQMMNPWLAAAISRC
jgi:hypothetical protein